MKLPWLLILALLQHYVLALTPTKRSHSTHDYYVIEHNPSATASLDDIMTALVVELVEKVGELPNTWLVRRPKRDLTLRSNDPDSVFNAFNVLRQRGKGAANAHLALRSEDVIKARAILHAVKFISQQTLRQRTKRAPPPLPPSDNVAARFGIVDPMFPQQWHLVNGEFPEHTMNVTPVWEMGFTGKGVISSLVDDGLDYTSLDLKDNFVSSYHDFLACLNLNVSRTRMILTTSTTMNLCQPRRSSMIIMVPAVLDKLRQSKTMLVVSVLLTSPRLRAYAYSLGLYQM